MNYDYTQMLGFIILKGEVSIKRRLLQLFKDKGYGITFEQWTVLNIIYVKPESIQSEIAEKTFKDKTNVTRILDTLSRKGLVVREYNGHDRRSYSVSLTKQGSDLFQKLVPDLIQTNEQIKEGINDQDFKVFQKVLNQIYKNIS